TPSPPCRRQARSTATPPPTSTAPRRPWPTTLLTPATATRTTGTGGDRFVSAPAIDSRRQLDRGLFAFYTAVAVIALAGQTGAAVEWLHWWPLFALAAVAAVEFGGIVLSAYADHRRRLGERAWAARALSAAVAAGAVAVNWLGHHDRLQGGFFAGMSGLGYLV